MLRLLLDLLIELLHVEIVETFLVQFIVKFLEEVVLTTLIVFLELFKSKLLPLILRSIVDLGSDMVGLKHWLLLCLLGVVFIFKEI